MVPRSLIFLPGRQLYTHPVGTCCTLAHGPKDAPTPEHPGAARHSCSQRASPQPRMRSSASPPITPGHVAADSAPSGCSKRPPSLPIFPWDVTLAARLLLLGAALLRELPVADGFLGNHVIDHVVAVWQSPFSCSSFVIYASRTFVFLSHQWPNLRACSRPIELLALSQSYVILTLSVFTVRSCRSYAIVATPAFILQYRGAEASSKFA